MTAGRALPVAVLILCTPILRAFLAGRLGPDAAAIRAGMGFVLAWGACTLLGGLVARYRSLADSGPKPAPPSEEAAPPEQAPPPRRRSGDIAAPAPEEAPLPATGP